MFENRPVFKVGWRAYLVPRNYDGNLDCGQATCTQLEKCRGGTEEVTRCLDAQNRDFAQGVAGGRMQRVHGRRSQVLSACRKVGYSATLARAHLHRFICSENRGLPSLRDLCKEFIAKDHRYYLNFVK